MKYTLLAALGFMMMIVSQAMATPTEGNLESWWGFRCQDVRERSEGRRRKFFKIYNRARFHILGHGHIIRPRPNNLGKKINLLNLKYIHEV